MVLYLGYNKSYSMKKLLLMGAFLMVTLTIQAQTADEIIAKSLAARGGADKLKAIKSVRMATTTKIMGNEIKSVASIVAGQGMRSDMSVMGQTMSQGFDGTKGWMINPMAGPDAQEMPAEMSKTFAGQLDLAGPMVDYKTKNNKVEFAGKEVVDGKETYKLIVTRADSTVMTHYINATTFLDQKVVTKGKAQGQDVEVEAYFDDYRAVDGIKFPHATEMTNPQFGRMKITFDKIEVNPVIDAATFRMPAKK